MKLYLVIRYSKFFSSTPTIECGYINKEDAQEHCKLFDSDVLYDYKVIDLKVYDHLKQFGE